MSSFLSSFNKTTKANNSGKDDGVNRISASVSAANMRFTIQPITPGESGFSQWVAAMKMVAQLPGGIPPEFRRRLWVTMAERHLASRGVDWSQVEKTCFSDWSHHADDELGIQIVKDLHRTGCSLFCGDEGQQNQALLKKVLMAYARWNKAVGYCQGFNMLAALILQVTDRCASDALKLMIYLIEGVLPDSYFADSLRGLSVDMAVFRELLRSKLPRLSKHLDLLQTAAKDGARSYEPPLTNVFTMQWFLTLFCNCLPHPTVLRVWDLIFLEGNAVLLRTALAIWQVLAQRILLVRTADEFYCVMGALTRELLESNLIDANTLVEAIVAIGPITELKSLREHYLYNITPWGAPAPNTRPTISLHPKMDIGALKQQYVKLKQRQRQAHVIFTSAVSGRPAPAATPVMNHLLVGKRALGPSKRPGPPKGSIPPARQHHQVHHPSTLHWKDTTQPPTTTTTTCSSSSSSDTELCDEDDVQSSEDDLEEKETEISQFVDNSKPTTTSDNLIQSDNLSPSPSLKIPSDCEEGDQSAEFELFLADRLKSGNNLLTPSPSPKVPSDSEEGDETAEFEKFLADRLKGDQAARRNSELALQIIQENSLILHRIMQCQSRLSPSPPLLGQTPPIKDDLLSLSDEQPIKDNFETMGGVINPIQMLPIEGNCDDHIPSIEYNFGSISRLLMKDESDPKMSSDFDPLDDKQSIKNLTEPHPRNKLLIQNNPDPTIEEDFNTIQSLLVPTLKDESDAKLQLIKAKSDPQLLDDKHSIKTSFDTKRSISHDYDFDLELLIKERSAETMPIKDDPEAKIQSCQPLKEDSHFLSDNKQSIKDNFDSEPLIKDPILDDSHPTKNDSYHDLLITNDFDPVELRLLGDRQPIKNESKSNLVFNVDPNLDTSLTDTKEYSSRLRSLLEKSKSLDEKYNCILNKDKLAPTLGGLHESKSEEPLTFESDNKSIQLIQENLHLLKTYSANKLKEERTSLSRKLFQENVCLLESISSKSDSALTPLIDFLAPQNFTNDASLSPSSDFEPITFQDNCESTLIDSSTSGVKSESVLTPDDKFESTSVEVTVALSPSIDSSNDPISPNKSPNHTMFNPFPVTMNSRQNKEVAVKLGLYKK